MWFQQQLEGNEGEEKGEKVQALQGRACGQPSGEKQVFSSSFLRDNYPLPLKSCWYRIWVRRVFGTTSQRTSVGNERKPHLKQDTWIVFRKIFISWQTCRSGQRSKTFLISSSNICVSLTDWIRLEILELKLNFLDCVLFGRAPSSETEVEAKV